MKQDARVTQVRPTTPDGVADAVVQLVSTRKGRIRLAIDGAPAARPDELAALVVAALGPRPALHVRADAYLRQASLRFEHGRDNPDAWLDEWLDVRALRREVLDDFVETGWVLPALRDPISDRSLRATPVELPGDAVVIVSGSALLGRGLPFDVCVHIRLSPQALARRTPADQAWILPALARYEQERDPEDLADLVVRADDPRHPAVVI